MKPIRIPDSKSPDGAEKMRRILADLQKRETVTTLPEEWLVSLNFWPTVHPKFIAEVGILTAGSSHLYLYCKDGRVLYTPVKKPRHQRVLRGGWTAGVEDILIRMEETMTRTMDQIAWRCNILPGIVINI